MAVRIITVSSGSVDPERPTVRRRDTVVWVPTSDDVKIEIDFRDKSPFKRKTFPNSPSAGEGVAAIVRGNAEFIEHPYKRPGRRRRLHPRADPVIIVRRDRLGPKAKKDRAKTSARKK